MRKIMIAIATFVCLSSVTLKQVEPALSNCDYKQVVVGDRTLLIKDEQPAMNDSIAEALLPPKKLHARLMLPAFKHKIGILESNGSYTAVNRLGYVGKYQFSRRTLRRLINKGYLNLTDDELKNFRDLPDVQEQAMDALVRANLETLKNWKLDKYIGKRVGGVTVTVEGMLAASHLLGPYAVKDFLVTGGSLQTVYVRGVKVAKYDANGTCLTTYMKHFA